MKFAPKPAAGILEQKRERISLKEFQAEKCIALAEAATLTKGKKKFIRAGVEVEIVSATPIQDTLRLWLQVKKDGKKVDLTIPKPGEPESRVPLNPLILHNPPILFPAETWRKEKDEEGNDVEIENMVEDPEAVLQEEIFSFLSKYLK